VANQLRGKRADRTKFVCRDSVLRFASEELFTPDRTPDPYILKSVLCAVLGEFLSEAEFDGIGKASERAVDKLIAYVADNFAENITLKGAAVELGYEFHYLSKAFHKRIPINFSQYVNLYRIENATFLLHNTDLPITEIALKCGFQSIRNFNRVYSSVTGSTPSKDIKSNK
jgi:AraC-like DNA-binding protein